VNTKQTWHAGIYVYEYAKKIMKKIKVGIT